MTTVISPRRVRDDVPEARPATSRGWALAGVAAGFLGLAGALLPTLVTPVYDDALMPDAVRVAEALADFKGLMVAFHVTATLSLLLLPVFALGLARRLRDALPAGGLLPGVAAFGLLATSVVVLMGTSLDTEFVAGIGHEEMVLPEMAVLYNHWIGTVPMVWGLTGLTGLALHQAARQGALPRWIGRTGLVLGGLSLLLTVAPLQYAAGLTGTLLVLVTACGLAFGDKAHRA